MNLRGQPAVVLEAGGDVGDVELRFDDRLAAVAGLELRELVGTVADDLRELEQDAAAVLGGGVLPGTFVERTRARLSRRGRRRAADMSGMRAMTSVVAGSMTSIVSADSRCDECSVDVGLIGLHAGTGKPQLYQLTRPRLIVAR